MKITYLGNFKFPYCTESHIAATLEDMGNTVYKVQEDETSIDWIVNQTKLSDIFLWTRTPGFLRGNGFDMLKQIKSFGVTTVSFHLDYYFGISRELLMKDDPFWFTDFVFQPDGDHLKEFKKLGSNAYWSPPAVIESACYLDQSISKTHDLIFVGSHSSYHSEWPWRTKLVDFLRSTYPQFEALPQGEAIRENDLNSLYQSTKVVIGDSIMADTNKTYTSDRIFETTGRGGFIIYPAIPWVKEVFGYSLATFTVGNTDELKSKIDYFLDEEHAQEREDMRKKAFEITKKSHTYRNRLKSILEIIAENNKK